MTAPDFLPGVPAAAVMDALSRAPGNTLASGKFDSPDSSAALAASAFGWFLQRPRDLPALPGVPMGRIEAVEIAAEMQLPWKGGKHPWLDVGLTTATTLVGIAVTRYEPFRPQKAVRFTEPYDSRDWGPGMARIETLRRGLADGSRVFRTLDAALLVRHAYGLRNQGVKRAKGAVLVYLYAEPAAWANGKPVDPGLITLHRSEVAAFAAAVRGSDVAFVAVRWADLLAQWAGAPMLAAHAAALSARFGLL